MTNKVTIIGGGLAGCEAAWSLATRGVQVELFEMKPYKYSPAHISEGLAELVCSNSFRSAALASAAGLLKEELRILGSLIIEAADSTAVPAGKALAVDRNRFSEHITAKLSDHPLVTIRRSEVEKLPASTGGSCIVATGPLTSSGLANDIAELFGLQGLSFYDAIAPVISADSLDMSQLFRASRYDVGEEDGDYINCPMDEELYNRFVQAVISAEKVNPHPFEDIPHFEGCLPVEILADRGIQTLAFGPMKPVGLVDPKTGKRPHAVVQLRAENKERTLYNMVGFQTKMTYPEQERIFRMIPGLQNAVFERLGSVHRNTYINAPEILDEYSRAKAQPNLMFAGQITGVEGYVESTASGLIVGIYAAFSAKGKNAPIPPSTTAIGAMIKHTRDKSIKRYEPMNVNFGIMDPAPRHISKKAKKEFLAQKALEDVRAWKNLIEEEVV